MLWLDFASTGMTGVGRAAPPIATSSTEPLVCAACGAGEPWEPSLPPPTCIVIRFGLPGWVC